MSNFGTSGEEIAKSPNPNVDHVTEDIYHQLEEQHHLIAIQNQRLDDQDRIIADLQKQIATLTELVHSISSTPVRSKTKRSRGQKSNISPKISIEAPTTGFEGEEGENSQIATETGEDQYHISSLPPSSIEYTPLVSPGPQEVKQIDIPTEHTPEPSPHTPPADEPVIPETHSTPSEKTIELTELDQKREDELHIQEEIQHHEEKRIQEEEEKRRKREEHKRLKEEERKRREEEERRKEEIERKKKEEELRNLREETERRRKAEEARLQKEVLERRQKAQEKAEEMQRTLKASQLLISRKYNFPLDTNIKISFIGTELDKFKLDNTKISKESSSSFQTVLLDPPLHFGKWRVTFSTVTLKNWCCIGFIDANQPSLMSGEILGGVQNSFSFSPSFGWLYKYHEVRQVRLQRQLEHARSPGDEVTMEFLLTEQPFICRLYVKGKEAFRIIDIPAGVKVGVSMLSNGDTLNVSTFQNVSSIPPLKRKIPSVRW
ncbi:hypothetical protein BLNAU_364 [Blattamonas nauphoetae]|uniref:Uncharacterized protein n=1 Tax=Blattamonas nauphoetae TaxID=2049346 RepID=A0ABQ9YL20_9EUKA|nr:hypothetical protein BLNAU_364 [Blattamonas nauphoetae]